MTEESYFIMQGSISTVAIAFLQKSVLRMIPYSIVAVPLIVLDLIYGIKAAIWRKEKIRISTAIRRTVTKTFGYACWIILASTISLSFNIEWLEWCILGLVFANELASIVGNYLETKGLEVSWKAVWNTILRIIGQKANIDTDGIDVGEMVKPKPKPPQPRNAKGQFTSKKDVRP